MVLIYHRFNSKYNRDEVNMQDKKNYSIEELLNAALQCEEYQEYDMALKYYRAVLEKEPKQSAAKMGVERAQTQLAKTIYFRSEANFKLVTGRLELRKGMIVFITDSSVETEYDMELIDNPTIKLGRLIFDYKGEPIDGYSCPVSKKWVSIINEVKQGKYPPTENGSLNAVETYIKNNYTLEKIEDAIEYFMGITGCDYSDAKIVVIRILYM